MVDMSAKIMLLRRKCSCGWKIYMQRGGDWRGAPLPYYGARGAEAEG